jgi:hypothetical protein
MRQFLGKVVGIVQWRWFTGCTAMIMIIKIGEVKEKKEKAQKACRGYLSSRAQSRINGKAHSLF